MTPCTTKDCDNPVMVVYHWPGKVGEHHCCLLCAMGWEKTFAAMGWPFDGRPMTQDEQMEAYSSGAED